MAVLVLLVPAYYFANDIYRFVATPLLIHLPDESGMIATQVASPFLTPFKLAVIAAVVAAMPFILHQAWWLLSPGLHLHQQRRARLALWSSILLFYAGMTFAHFVVLPLVFGFFAAVTPTGVTMMTDIHHYLEFVLAMLFAFGLVFEIPVIILLMVWSGFSTPESLISKRPYVIVGCFVIGMVLTPPDVFSQVLLAVPSWMLFELGVFVARRLQSGGG